MARSPCEAKASRVDGFFNNALLAEVAIYPTALAADGIAAHWLAASAKH